MNNQLPLFKVGDNVVAIKGSNFDKYEEGDVGVITDITSRPYPKVMFENATGLTGWNGWPLLENIRLATPVDLAEYNLKQAQAKLDAAKKAESAAVEAKRKAEEEAKRKAEEEAKLKAEEEAKRFTEEDVKSYNVVSCSSKPGGSLRMLIVRDDVVLFMNSSGFASWKEPRSSAVAFMNSTYFKTSEKLKDFFNA